jgi:hypothetical protein
MTILSSTPKTARSLTYSRFLTVFWKTRQELLAQRTRLVLGLLPNNNAECEVPLRPNCCTKPCFLPLLSRSALSLLSCKLKQLLSPASASSLAGEQGGTIVWLIPARCVTLRCAAAWGNRQTMRVGLAPFRKSSLRKPDCQQPPRCFCAPTARPLNKNSQQIQSVLVFSGAWTLRLRLGFAPRLRQPPHSRLGRLGLVAPGRWQSASGRRACAEPEFPPYPSFRFGADGGHAAAWRFFYRSLHSCPGFKASCGQYSAGKQRKVLYYPPCLWPTPSFAPRQ